MKVNCNWHDVRHRCDGGQFSKIITLTRCRGDVASLTLRRSQEQIVMGLKI